MAKMYIWYFLTFYFVITSAQITKDIQCKLLQDGFKYPGNLHFSSKSIYFTDTFQQVIVKYNYEIGQTLYTKLDCGPVGPIIPYRGSSDKFVIVCGTDILLMKWNPKKRTTNFEKLGSLNGCSSDTIISNGKCDAIGRLWMGSLGDSNCNKITLDDNFYEEVDLTKSFKLINNSSGVAWDVGYNTLYAIELGKRRIVSYDYKLINGKISNKQVVFDLQKYNWSDPSGLTVDRKGNLWTALPFDSKIIEINPNDGTLLSINNLPDNLFVTDLAFGDYYLNTLFITTAEKDRDGALYQVTFDEGQYPNVFGVVESKEISQH